MISDEDIKKAIAPLPDEHREFVGGLTANQRAIYRMAKVAGSNIIARSVAEHEASHDQLTGLLNDRAWKRKLRTRIIGAEKTGTPFAILFGDISNLKKVNDEHKDKHAAGDRMLKLVGPALAKSLRSEDSGGDIVAHEKMVAAGEGPDISREQGDEFKAMIELKPRRGLRNQHQRTDLSLKEQLQLVADRWRETFVSQLHEIDVDPNEFGASIAIGGAIWQPGSTLESMLSEADKAMYRDKEKQHQELGQYRS